MKYKLKEIAEKDKRGQIKDATFVEQIGDTTAIFEYCGQGETHEGIFSYNLENGWKFEKYYDRWYENLSDEEKTKAMNDIFWGLKKSGFTAKWDEGDYISFNKAK